MRLDIRTKLLITLTATTGAIITANPIIIFKILLVTIPFLLACGAPIYKGIRTFCYFLIPLAIMFIIQNMFRPGDSIIEIAGIKLLTEEGLYISLTIAVRIFTIMVVNTLILTANSRELIAAITKMHIPYEIIFMVQTAVRFLPILKEEFKTTLNSVRLRGTEINKVHLRKTFKLLSVIFSPVVVGIWNKAENLSLAMEMRGFRMYPSRTSIYNPRMNFFDYIVAILYLFLFILIFY